MIQPARFTGDVPALYTFEPLTKTVSSFPEVRIRHDLREAKIFNTFLMVKGKVLIRGRSACCPPASSTLLRSGCSRSPAWTAANAKRTIANSPAWCRRGRNADSVIHRVIGRRWRRSQRPDSQENVTSMDHVTHNANRHQRRWLRVDVANLSWERRAYTMR